MGDVWPVVPDSSSPTRMAGLAFMTTGVFLFAYAFVGAAGDPFYLDLEKRLIFLVLGCLLCYLSRGQSSAWNRFASKVSLGFIVVGLLGLAFEPDLGFMRINAPWESIFYVVVGMWQRAALWSFNRARIGQG